MNILTVATSSAGCYQRYLLDSLHSLVNEECLDILDWDSPRSIAHGAIRVIGTIQRQGLNKPCQEVARQRTRLSVVESLMAPWGFIKTSKESERLRRGGY